ncbi:hypothetical protein P3342_012724 [Pyrenophora teres f. teres]|nr:hypothetical protein P3342_012724 [Pyrenophora teres f. teres]
MQGCHGWWVGRTEKCALENATTAGFLTRCMCSAVSFMIETVEYMDKSECLPTSASNRPTASTEFRYHVSIHRPTNLPVVKSSLPVGDDDDDDDDEAAPIHPIGIIFGTGTQQHRR